MKELVPDTVESSELVEQTFRFWFGGQQHIRTPFPEYIREELRKKATQRFFEWASTLGEEADEQINDTIIGEKFEEIIFETALGMVMTDDERITINYPFLPRLGDVLEPGPEQKEGSSVVTDRYLTREEDQLFLLVKLEKKLSGEKWETRFELPA